MISASLALVPLAGMCYQYFATRQAEKTYPPPGNLVDVGGYKLHIQCKGENRPHVPTVIVETGIWDCSLSWQLVQSKIAQVTKICTYDRAGYGWSDSGPNPRTFKQMTQELKVLLEKQQVQPPFILVGHSLGGPIARYYQSQYPNEVVGMIFVDALHKELPEFSRTFKIVSRAFSFLAYFGVLGLLCKLCPPLSANPKWTQALQETYTACHQTKLKTFVTCLQEWDGYAKSFEDLKAQAKSIANIPVTIISRDPQKTFRPATSEEAVLKGIEEQKRLNAQHLDESPHARFIVAANSGHLVQLDRPDVIIQEIQTMVDLINKKQD